ncbi:MAG: family 10 glycosylhydrolase [Candidatus Delongbacteria bacterium]|nr:family 10 glycosylhydrolase [Candidatus Delongbacteria bacterium]
MLVGGGCVFSGGGTRKPAWDPEQPSVRREFRAVWVATVANIDWPSKPGLTTAEQQAEAIAILDSAAALTMNAIVLQVRPQCDAFYRSDLEPWSYFLTGQQGQAPDPYYDPLEFWVTEAHKRGMELHAWFNPYRAHHHQGGVISESSIVKRKPELVRGLKNGMYWMDPADPLTRKHSLDVVMDVVRRYDVDGIHFDDYFYPYAEYNEGQDFPDSLTWNRYQAAGGKLSRSDWRRESVNRFIKEIYQSIKKEKRQVRFGISPFGFWKPGYPRDVVGFSQYDQLYADALLWLEKGWLDYFTPQLYWPISRLPLSFPVLLGWWGEHNPHQRHLWPGMAVFNMRGPTNVEEAVRQIMITRGMETQAPGHIHFSMKSFTGNVFGINDSLRAGPYRRQALAPAFPWLDTHKPNPPKVSWNKPDQQIRITWEQPSNQPVFRWVLYYQYHQTWEYQILNSDTRQYQLKADIPDPADSTRMIPLRRIAVTAVSRSGNESQCRIIELP